jgi:hypothetical protein
MMTRFLEKLFEKRTTFQQTLITTGIALALIVLLIFLFRVADMNNPRISDAEIASLLSQSSYKIVYHEDHTKDWLVVKDRNVYIAKFRGSGKLTSKDTAEKYFYFVEIGGIKQTLESYLFHK